MPAIIQRQIYYKFVSARRPENKAAIDRGTNIMRTRADRCLVSRTETYTRDSGLPQIRDIVGRHVLGNWLSDRMARSRLAAAAAGLRADVT